MSDNINKIWESHQKKDEEWTKYQNITEKNLDIVESAIESSEEKCKQYESTIESIKELSKTARSNSYVKICSLAYVNAFVVHTGEYNVDLSPDYQVTLTKDQTVEYLEEQLTGERGVQNSFKLEKEQLQQRLGYDLTEFDDIPDVSHMPESIMSDKGMAFKRGNFFEIIEEDDIPCIKGKRTSRIKTKIEQKIKDMKLDEIEDINERAEAFLNLIEN